MKRRSRTGAGSVKPRRRKAAAPKRSIASNAARNRGASIAGPETAVARLTHERDEALLREAANSEILRLISRSPGDPELVFRSILENATRICNANFGNLFRFDGGQFYPAAQFNTPAALLEALTRRGPFKPTPGTSLDHVMRTKQVLHSADTAAKPVPGLSATHGGARTQVTVPMLKDDALIGAILIYRQEVRPFTDKQIELVMNFAAQAVIAIENTRLLNELRQSLEQQTATADVLRVISSSPGELEPVFQAMLENATRICEANFGILQLYQDGTFRLGAMHNAPPAFAEALAQRGPLKPGPLALMSRVVATKQLVHVSDYADEPAYKQRDPSAVRLVELAGGRTIVMVPMLKEMELIGIIQIYRQEVRPFTDKQIALVQNFAAQAVIAIENTRLLNELRQRTNDLSEALEQQTATSEVLRVIGSSPGELKPVFDAMLQNATRICEAKFGTLYLREAEGFRTVAAHNAPPAYIEARTRELIRPAPDTALGGVAATKRVVHIADIKTIPSYIERNPFEVITVELGGYRTVLAVPMLKNNELIGVITINRQEVCPFTDKQIALVENFAAQAVIAIENARLLNELRETLDQQTATSDVLRIIASSPGELDPVFKAMLENARHICDAKFGILMLRESDGFRSVAIDGAPPAYTEAMREDPHIPPRPGSGLVALVETKKPVQLADIQTERGYAGNRLSMLAGARTLLIVPLLKDDAVIGAINIYRQEVRAFTEQQIVLLQNFAAQAVIAIENARLLNELRQSLEQQTATADVLRVISSSPGELEPVFNALLENAVRLCDAKFGNLFLYDGASFHTAALRNAPKAYLDYQQQRGSFVPPPGTLLDRIVKTRDVVYILDDAAEPVPSSSGRLAGARSHVAVPMFKDDALVGAIVIYHQEVRPFTDKQIELLQNFAAQAVIAIENARLLNELRQSLEQQTATSEVLRVISSSPGELETVFQAVLENAVRICEAKFANLFLTEGDAFRNVALYGAPRAFEEARRKQPLLKLSTGTALDRMAATKSVAQTLDAQTDPSYRDDPQRALFLQESGGRTVVCIPLMKEADLVGGFSVYRQEVRPFTEKQIALLQNFAAQAVIAIENARLLDDLNKLNRQLEQRVADQVGEIERMSRLRRFLPPQVADLIVASGTEKQLESHRREITALFCDLRGFTGFSESSDPEDVLALLRQYHAAIGQIIIKYGGTLERFAGDGVMVIFNDPVPVENPALQAVRMALDMRAALGALIEKWRRLGHELGFGIGIAHGYATLGTIGFEGRFDYAAIGTVSNVASRLCDEAKPGQILISPRVLMAVEDAISVEPVGDFALKGISRPLAAYNVVGVK